MTVHRWFANKSCPGDYLYNRHGDIADRVNKLLGVTSTPKDEPTDKQDLKMGDTVKLVKGATYTSGKSIPAWVFEKTLYVRKINGESIMFSTLKSGAVTGIVNRKYLTKFQDVTPATPVKLAVGDVVQLVSGAKYTTGKSVPNWVIKSKLYAREIQEDYVVISTLKTGDITGAVPKKYVLKNGHPVCDGSANVLFKVGDVVKLVSGAKYSTGKAIPSWVFGCKLYVRQLRNNDQVVISTLKTGEITGVVDKKDLVKA
jgi:transcription antitermination factor NusG